MTIHRKKVKELCLITLLEPDSARKSYRSLPRTLQDSAPWDISDEDAHCSLDLVLDHKTRSIDAGKGDIIGVDPLIKAQADHNPEETV